MRSHGGLLEASGYTNHPRDFQELLRILDSEIRLITPTDPEGQEQTSASQEESSEKHYQLTHDYLVHSLRDWLTRKQKETRRGRAELLLADRAAVWNARPENRLLPSLWQWGSIRWLTQKKTWTPSQRRMLAKAGRYHAVREMMVAVILGLVGWGIYEGHSNLKAHALRDRLLDANISEVPTIMQDMVPYRRWLDPLLYHDCEQAQKQDDGRKQLHTSLALLPVDATQITYLKGRLLDAEAGEVAIIRDVLFPHRDQLIPKLWTIVESPQKGQKSQRLRAAAALAKYDPESGKWAKISALVVHDLVRENPVHLLYWSEAFRPVKASFLLPLSEIFRDQQYGINPAVQIIVPGGDISLPDDDITQAVPIQQDLEAPLKSRLTAERSLATNLLADYAAGQPRLLADLLMDADENQFGVVFPKLKAHGEKALPLLTGEINKKMPPDMPSSDKEREKLAKRQANAAVALLMLNQAEKVWPLLKHSPDPRVRSYLIERFGPLGTDAGSIIKRLDEEPDITIRRALILSLGKLKETQFPPTTRTLLIPKLQAIYRTEADPGMHASAEWLLRHLKQEGWLKNVNEKWAKDKQEREKRLESIRERLTKDRERTPPQWYVNGQGQAMVVIPGPVQFMMGSPPTEIAQAPQLIKGGPSELQHRKRIGRTFAIAATPVTKEQFLRFVPKFGHNQMGALSRLDLPDWRHSLVRGGGILQLAKLQGRNCEGRVVLRDGPERTGDEAEEKLLKPEWLPAAHGSRVGVCLPGGSGDLPLLWRVGGVAGNLQLVLAKQQGAYLAGGDQETKRSGTVRYARKHSELVPRCL